MTAVPVAASGSEDENRWPMAVGVLTALVLGALVVVLARWGPDWPAQEFRAWLGSRDSWALYTTRWYSGDSMLGYSVLYPPLAGTIGAGAVGVLSVAVATWASCAFAPRSSRLRAVLFDVGVAVSLAIDLVIGQVPFLLAAAFAALGLRVVLGRRHRPIVVALAAALASLASPLCGAFLLIALPAVAMKVGWRRAMMLTPAVAGSAVAALAGGAGGWFPCPWQTLLGVVIFCVALALCAPRGDRALRLFALCYLVAAIALFVVPNPVGGNVARLGKLVALPLACWLIRVPKQRSKRVIVVLTVVCALLWPGEGLVSSMARGATDASQRASFYTGLDRYLARHWIRGERLEIPFTREHWEAYFVARRFPIARGWDRQSDLQYNSVLYSHLTPLRYRSWLNANAVGYVALPDVPIDFGGRAEAQLLRRPPGYLRLVWKNRNWKLWKVVDPTPLVSGPAHIVNQRPTSLTLAFDHPGTALVRVRATGQWQTTSARSCANATPAGWTRVVNLSGGPVTLTAGLGTTGTAQAACPMRTSEAH